MCYFRFCLVIVSLLFLPLQACHSGGSSKSSQDDQDVFIDPPADDELAAPLDPIDPEPPVDEEEAVLVPNNAPVLSNQTLVASPANYMGRVCTNALPTVLVSLNGTDADNDSLTYAISELPAVGTASITGSTLGFTPPDGFSETVTIEVTASDGTDISAPATITINPHVEAGVLESTAFIDRGVVFTGKPGSYTDAFGVGGPAVVYNPQTNQYVMYFESQYQAGDATCGGGYWGIGRAVSSDGITWVMDDNRVISPIAGSDYECIAAHPAALFDGTNYHLFFKMHHTPGGGAAQDGIGFATSTDGIHFGAVQKINSGIKSYPTAVMVNNTLYVYYMLQKPQNSSWIGVVWSNDRGLTWNSTDTINPVLASEGPQSTGVIWAGVKSFESPSVVCADDLSLEFVLSGIKTDNNSIGGYFVSGLEESLTLDTILDTATNPVWSRHGEILKDGNNYKMWYKTDVSGKRVIGFAETRL